ncbi:MAG: MFS transporter [Rhodospirillales bacterium]|nr:MFS transporter [Rhodospirillales bacterium]MBT5075061.1 MFS transporter [Rhodospirillales bacterium]MBT5113320.1 MFS transporter [Rhodospirillales bacterium]MBT5672146.1 MFS transporter [Rhodospirillales bacterium]MBT6187099.1 MFS transporter [Rhodospirillales bacterium]
MSTSPSTPAPAEPITLRLQLAVYICGIFSSGTSNLIWVIVPLWALKLDASPMWIGIALGSYTFMPLLLSIPGGALIDRIGARRMIWTFGSLVVCVSLLYPVMPWLIALVILQMIVGLSVSMAWISTQALIGQRMKGETLYAGRLAFATRIGSVLGPPAIGAAWDYLGAWGAFGFVSLWTSGMLLGISLLPKSAKEIATPPERPRLGDFRPKLSSYTDAFKLLSLPPILLVVVVAILRQSGQGIQSSFYVVYLESINFSGTLIGTLLSGFLLAGAFGSLVAAPLAKAFNRYWVMIAAVALSIVCIAITPLMGTYVLLMVAIMCRGLAIGTIQPLMLNIVSKSADANNQGKAVGLRASANRLAMTIMPIIMGVSVEFWGLENAFMMVGSVLLVLLFIVAIKVSRLTHFSSQ